MKKSKIELAKLKIISYFSDSSKRIFGKKDIALILENNRTNWKLSYSMSLTDFLDFLLNSTQLKKHYFQLGNRPITRYSWGDVSIYPLLLSLEDKAYFSHYSAMYFNNLTDQIPKIIYINLEQTPKPRPRSPLEQSNIDKAFKNKQRVSNNYLDYENFRVCILNGKFTGGLGAIEMNLSGGEKILVTGIERTLIDITVRPVYAGGVYEVSRAYQAAKEKVSSNRISAMLKTLDYIYPYHQAIGFYMKRAGYRETVLDLFRDFGIKYDFYLTHNMKQTEYDKEWRLYYPKGF